MPGFVHGPAYDAGFLQVGDIHAIHYKQHGNSKGKPVIFLHGGPGGETTLANTAYFDPNVYRVVLLDQRGCGKSTPTCELRENTSEYLVSDIEVLRQHLGISKWHLIFGGSWGSTLGLLYAQAHPHRVCSLVLRGIFLARKSEVDWGRHTDPSDGGCAHLFPEAYEEFLQHFTQDERRSWKHSADWEETMLKELTSPDDAVKLEAARVLNTLDFRRSTLIFDPESMKKLKDDKYSLHHATLELYYLMNGAFIREGQILEEAEMQKIRHLPCTIIQGRYDSICPTRSAWDLHKAWPEAEFVMVPDAGHSATEPGTFRELVRACDKYAKLNT